MRAVAIALLLCLLSPGLAIAVQPDEVLRDAALEARARALSAELRCMVCQNQSIDDSDAPLAKDLRVLVRERLEAGDSDEEVKSFLVARYGDYVLLRPPFDWRTWIAWLAPFALLAIGLVAAIQAGRRRRAAGPPPLTEEEKAAVDRIVKG
jgi:cytochrome c-type biogenesis protein CcmH